MAVFIVNTECVRPTAGLDMGKDRIIQFRLQTQLQIKTSSHDRVFSKHIIAKYINPNTQYVKYERFLIWTGQKQCAHFRRRLPSTKRQTDRQTDRNRQHGNDEDIQKCVQTPSLSDETENRGPSFRRGYMDCLVTLPSTIMKH